MAHHGGEHAGWIYKQGSLVKNWKRRFMVLRGKQLTYYDTEKISPRVKEKGSFQVITVEPSSDIQNGLIVHGRGGRVLKLYTDSADATTAWYQAIVDATTGAAAVAATVAAERLTERYSSLSGSNHDSIDLDDEMDLLDRLESLPLDENQVQHSGWLTKEGMRVKSWKKRYFTLRGDTLSYFDSKDTGRNAKGYGHVRAVEVNGEKAHTLDIRFDNGRILRVSAESASDMQEWLCHLSDAIEAATADNNVTRQSIAARQSLRASISGVRPPRANNMVPMRHSMAAPPLAAGSAPPRPSLAAMTGRKPFPSPMPSSVPVPSSLERSRSGNSSYQSSSLSFSYQSSNVSDNQPAFEYDSDSDDGDWI